MMRVAGSPLLANKRKDGDVAEAPFEQAQQLAKTIGAMDQSEQRFRRGHGGKEAHPGGEPALAHDMRRRPRHDPVPLSLCLPHGRADWRSPDRSFRSAAPRRGAILPGAVTSAVTTLNLSPKPFRAAFLAASAQSLASISTAVSLMPGTRAKRQSPATPTPAPTSSTRSPARAGTAAARNTASLPALWPSSRLNDADAPAEKIVGGGGARWRLPALRLLSSEMTWPMIGLGEQIARLCNPCRSQPGRAGARSRSSLRARSYWCRRP